MKVFLLILFFTLFIPGTLFCQTAKLEWAKQYAGPSYDAGQAIALDAAGNIYATGYFSATVDFDPGPGVYNLTSSAAEDIYITKSAPNGNLIWAKSIGDFRYQAGYAITLDPAGNIYVTGIFFGTVDFDPGPGESKLISAGNEDVFILKLDNNGNFKWAKKFGGPTNDYSNAIILDNAGNIYLNGYFDGTSNFDTDNGVYNLTSHGATDIYVCKLNSSGSLIWARNMGGAASDAVYGIGLDNQNNVYSTGFFFGTADFDPGPGVANLQATGFGDGVIIKLSNSGDLIWAKQLGGTKQVRCNCLKVNPASGYLYIAGYFDGDADFDPGPGTSILSAPIDEEDVFVAKYDLNSNLKWAKQMGGPSFQEAYGIDTDDQGNVYTTGFFDVSADFDPGPGNYNLTATGLPDAFVSKLNAAGDFVWAVKASGDFFEGGYSVKANKTGEVYVLGTFNGTTDFDPGSEIYNLTSAGQSEVFMLKLKQCYNVAITNTMNITACSAYTLNNKTYDSSGTYSQSILNSTGCDSILIDLHLTINRSIFSFNKNICQGNTWFAGGRLQNKSGIYFDTLQTAAGCDSVVITRLIVNANPKPNLGGDRNLCAGQSLVLSPGVFQSYAWQDNSTQAAYTVTAPGTYSVTVTDNNNCKAAAVVKIKKLVIPPARFLPADKTLCRGNLLQLNIPGFKKYLWDDGSVSSSKDIRNAGTYFLTVTDFDDCAGTDTVTITATDCIVTGIPNVFTPNNDGLNDFFRPVINTEIKQYRLQVFNRAGRKIFETSINSKGWDGTYKLQPQPAGAYVYQMEFTDSGGKTFIYSGSITLLR